MCCYVIGYHIKCFNAGRGTANHMTVRYKLEAYFFIYTCINNRCLTQSTYHIIFSDHLMLLSECHLSGDSSSQNTSLVYNDLDTSLVKVCVQGKNKKDNITVVMKKVGELM